MNKNLNIEDIQKFTKYQLKMMHLQNGGGMLDLEKKHIYDQKLNEYTHKLKKSGVNVEKLKEIIQRGGNPLIEVNNLKEEIIKQINQIDTTTKITELSEKISKTNDMINDGKKNFDKVAESYKTYAKETNNILKNIKDNVETKANEVNEANKATETKTNESAVKIEIDEDLQKLLI